MNGKMKGDDDKRQKNCKSVTRMIQSAYYCAYQKNTLRKPNTNWKIERTGVVELDQIGGILFYMKYHKNESYHKVCANGL